MIHLILNFPPPIKSSHIESSEKLKTKISLSEPLISSNKYNHLSNTQKTNWTQNSMRHKQEFRIEIKEYVVKKSTYFNPTENKYDSVSLSIYSNIL